MMRLTASVPPLEMRWVSNRAMTCSRHIRSVRPSLVFEIGFEGLNASTRHKSGVAVRFPRMLRIRQDKPLHEADTLASLQALMGWPGTAAAPESPPRPLSLAAGSCAGKA